ncbi:hypothetical protein AA0614_2608 [Komagataeibacter saccharivorans NRIC 0614]|nr:hypothetical protein AA0614_2608 [Komagataeibacter saccharivorans NRIC 0614]
MRFHRRRFDCGKRRSLRFVWFRFWQRRRLRRHGGFRRGERGFFHRGWRRRFMRYGRRGRAVVMRGLGRHIGADGRQGMIPVFGRFFRRYVFRPVFAFIVFFWLFWLFWPVAHFRFFSRFVFTRFAVTLPVVRVLGLGGAFFFVAGRRCDRRGTIRGLKGGVAKGTVNESLLDTEALQDTFYILRTLPCRGLAIAFNPVFRP